MILWKLTIFIGKPSINGPMSIATSTLQILEKYRCFRNLTYIEWFYPKHLDTTLVFDFRTLIAWFWVWTKAKKCLQRIKRLGRKPAKPRKKKNGKKRKNPQKNAKTRKSWNLVVLGSFRIFLLFQKSSRFVYPAVVLRFSQKHTCLEQSVSFFGLFDLSSWNDHFFLGSGGSRYVKLLEGNLSLTCIELCCTLFRENRSTALVQQASYSAFWFFNMVVPHTVS